MPVGDMASLLKIACELSFSKTLRVLSPIKLSPLFSIVEEKSNTGLIFIIFLGSSIFPQCLESTQKAVPIMGWLMGQLLSLLEKEISYKWLPPLRSVGNSIISFISPLSPCSPNNQPLDFIQAVTDGESP